MQFPALLVADLHLTDTPRDEYRWGLFPWLAQTCKEEKVKTLIVLGDLTDRKDYHSAELTNRITREFRVLTDAVKEIKVIPGNHDWLLDGQEFFRFLSLIPGVTYMSRPTEDDDVKGPATFYLPFTKTPAKDWANFDFSHYEFLFMHQTMQGSISSNGQAMDGETLPDLSLAGKVWSGDIHVPQVIGAVEYVGSPYHVHFGDSFKPRCVLLERGGRPVDLHFDTINRITLKVSSLKELHSRRDELKAHDQVKLRMELSEAEKHDWSKIRRQAIAWLKDQGVEVHGVELLLKKSTRRIINAEKAREHSPGDALYRFVEGEELGGAAYEIGLEILES